MKLSRDPAQPSTTPPAYEAQENEAKVVRSTRIGGLMAGMTLDGTWGPRISVIGEHEYGALPTGLVMATVYLLTSNQLDEMEIVGRRK